MTRHLDQFATGRLDHPTGCIVNTIVATQVTRVVVGDFVAQFLAEL